LDRHLQVVLRGRGAGEVQHRVDVAGHVHVVGDVVLDEGEPVHAEELVHVGDVPRDEVVDGDDLVAAGQQGATQMRPEEAGPTGDDSPHQRPIPWYSKPRRRSAAGSSRLRASTTFGSASSPFTLSKSSQRNSSHSVSTASTTAPSQAA